MIVIPMAGLSSRFTKAGYTEPKYMLPLWGGTVFDHSVSSFKADFEEETFLFIATQRPGIEAFVESRLKVLGVRNWSLELLEETTRGQAETVMVGVERSACPPESAITIFNIDTFGHARFQPKQSKWARSSGVLQVFRGSGDNWSFVAPSAEEDGRAIQTAEKQPISDLCCTGLYHFAKFSDYRRAFCLELKAPQAPELYVAPMYNHLIADGQAIHYDLIAEDDVVFCGVPAEYEAHLNRKPEE
ncbi:hypothetical protein KMP13_11555 [Epibacterium ulvae]|uniref:hypothetical protein n=1 Tax=Epibacterium ulvae TaxID=1156985 RepID=UPI001BFCA5BE|nr:hypothetical protein [Epibacterium ulvae]MBT8154522.1 hypothetical protein [Epibacterium ulvae]